MKNVSAHAPDRPRRELKSKCLRLAVVVRVSERRVARPEIYSELCVQIVIWSLIAAEVSQKQDTAFAIVAVTQDKPAWLVRRDRSVKNADVLLFLDVDQFSQAPILIYEVP